jgi:hypothetical protein
MQQRSQRNGTETVLINGPYPCSYKREASQIAQGLILTPIRTDPKTKQMFIIRALEYTQAATPPPYKLITR